jgi:hypothetical protein
MAAVDPIRDSPENSTLARYLAPQVRFITH